MTGRPQVVDRRSLAYAVTVVLVLLSGGTMVLAGVVAQADGWALGGATAIAGGALILAAFETARRARARRGHEVAVVPRMPVLAATMASGAIMLLAGYGATAWEWWIAPVLVPIGGIVIVAAFALELEATQRRT